MQHIPTVIMRNLRGMQRLPCQLMILMSGSTCSTGNPGLLTKTCGTIRDVSGNVFSFLVNFSHPPLVLDLFQMSRNLVILFYILFLASSWGRNGEIVSCAYYKLL